MAVLRGAAHGGDAPAEDLGLPFGRPVNVYGVNPSGTVVGAVMDEAPFGTGTADGRAW